jgi:hypothetical protein
VSAEIVEQHREEFGIFSNTPQKYSTDIKMAKNGHATYL